MSDYRDRRSSRGGGGDLYDRSPDRDRRPYPPPPRDHPGGGDDYYDRPPPRRRDDRDFDERRGGDGRGSRRGGGGGGYGRRMSRGAEYDDRMRSPELERGDGRGGKRRRSASPASPGSRRSREDYRDRAPRDDFPPRYRDDHDGPYPQRGGDFHGRPPPPNGGFDGFGGPHRGPPPPPRPQLEAPHTLPYLVNFRYFSDWFRSSNPPSLSDSPEALQDAWKKYESDYLRRSAKPPFEDFKDKAWFVDKYAIGEEKEGERRERRKEARKGRVAGWVETAEKGELEGLSFDFDELAHRKRMAIQPNEATLAQFRAEKGEDNESTKASSKRGDREKSTSAVPAATNGTEEGGDSTMADGEEQKKPDAVSAEEDEEKRATESRAVSTIQLPGLGKDALKSSSPETIVLPPNPEQICVARVPPTVTVRELEGLFTSFTGFTRLAVSAAAPHAGFLRLAWATFETAELAKEAFDTIMAAAPPPPEPTPVVSNEANGENGEKKDGDEQMKAEEDVKEEESKKEQAEEVKEEKDEEMKDDSAAPAPEGENGTESKPPAEDEKPSEPLPYSIGDFSLVLPGILSIRTAPIEARVRATPALMATADRVTRDLENVGKVIEALEKQREEDVGEGEEGKEGRKGSEVIREKREGWEKEVEEKKEGMDEEVYKKEMADVAKRTLDLSLSYLRSAFDTCYYCCVVCDSPEQLADMCPKHVRRADDGGNPMRRNNEMAWLDGFEKRVPLLFPRDQLDVRDYGGESRDEELYRLVQPHVKQEEEGKFRCKECNKLFSARKFVEKHITLKHAAIIGDALDQVEYFNNYVLDPSRIPLANFQRENYLPSILAPPPPPRPIFRPPPLNFGSPSLADRLGKRPRIEPRVDVPAGPPPPPPPGAKIDPRAQRGNLNSYADLDGPAGGGDEIVLPY
ncbi:hypothetical protein JCM8547_004875 [Rhodosporidiobolus lusitaniae]